MKSPVPSRETVRITSDLPIDGVVELWFEDTEVLNRAFASPQGMQAMKHAASFIDEITTFMVETHVVV